MIRKVQLQYTESLKGLRETKITQWLDRWEHAIKMAEKYKLPQITNGIWLMDLENAIRPISETYFVLYTKQADNTEKAHSSEYRKVAMELREAFANLSKVVPSSTTRGSAFDADYAGESEEDILTTEVQKGRGNSSSRSRKRAGTNLTEETSSKRSKYPKMPGMRYEGTYPS
jgi:hypothetical protein